jgi:hypothetical protein
VRPWHDLGDRTTCSELRLPKVRSSRASPLPSLQAYKEADFWPAAAGTKKRSSGCCWRAAAANLPRCVWRWRKASEVRALFHARQTARKRTAAATGKRVKILSTTSSSCSRGCPSLLDRSGGISTVDLRLLINNAYCL